MKVAILYVCTGQYTVFWHEFYLSFEKYFLNDCERHYFVFTDADKLEFEHENKNIHRIYQEAQPWPLPTLFRYKMFLQHEEELKEFDYIYFFNANSEAKQEITRKMILPRAEKGEDLVVAQHPGYYNCKNYDFPYDRNPKSQAFIPYGRGFVYVAGGVNGGTSKAFLKMCHVINERTENDYKKGIVALWHDESQINKYILYYNKYRLLDVRFVYPVCDWFQYSEQPIILLKNKQQYIKVNDLKGNEAKNKIRIPARLINKLMWKAAHLNAFRCFMNQNIARNAAEKRIS